MNRIEALTWPLSRVGEAIEMIARESGLAPRDVEPPLPRPDMARNRAMPGRWIEDAATWFGVEAEPVESPYPEVEMMLRSAGPALVQLPGNEPTFLALLGRRGDHSTILSSDLTVHRLRTETIRRTICHDVESPLTDEIGRLLEAVGVPRRRWERSVRAILRERLSHIRIDGLWLIRPMPGASFARHLRGTFLSRYGVLLGASHLLQYLLWLGAWWLIGKGALEGHLDAGWLIAWGLMLLTIVPLRTLETWMQGVISINAGAILKQRLLNGSLNLDPEEIKDQGSGQLLGQVIESEAIESLALGGGFLGLVSSIELALATVVLALGAGGIVHALLLIAWAGGGIAVGLRYYRLRLQWTGGRLDITHTLVERMIGHRTRLAQELPKRRHSEEDREVEQYLARSRKMDRSTALLEAIVPRGWLLVGLIGIAPAFVAQSTPESIAIGIGGILLAYAAFGKLAGGIVNLAGAAVAWQQISFLFEAASRRQNATSTFIASTTNEVARSETVSAPDPPEERGEGTQTDKRGRSRPNGRSGPLLEAHDLIFRYREHGEPVLRRCTLSIGRGDRILLEGSSGGGKSTLASLLVGLREPQSGLMLLDGLDRRTLGEEGWRRRVVAAPQFHENHILMGTFAFNLLMGRRWPPREEDFVEADTICRELGLGDLIERMPAGLMQNVGETGWQLSHGEQSRLFIARALLQGADLIVLDESFGALDPETLQLALRCVFDRAPSLLVIAHP